MSSISKTLDQTFKADVFYEESQYDRKENFTIVFHPNGRYNLNVYYYYYKSADDRKDDYSYEIFQDCEGTYELIKKTPNLLEVSLHNLTRKYIKKMYDADGNPILPVKESNGGFEVNAVFKEEDGYSRISQDNQIVEALIF